MKNTSITSLLSAIILLVTLSAAWPWSFEQPRPAALAARQQQGSSSQQASSTQNSAPPSTARQSDSASQQPSNTNSASSASPQTSGSSSNSNSNTNSNSNSGSSASRIGSVTGGNRGNGTRTTAIDPRLPPGGVAMITPAATDGMTFVKVGNQITFKWNYTSLSVPPSYIDVIATNTVNRQTYTIAANESWSPTQAITWDTNEYTKTTNLPFVVATYTLMIFDANSEPTAIPSAGYLGGFNNFQFGVYTPQPYTPLNEFRCATCNTNSAMSMHEKQAMGVLLGTCAITVLSFTWFAGVVGLF